MSISKKLFTTAFLLSAMTASQSSADIVNFTQFGPQIGAGTNTLLADGAATGLTVSGVAEGNNFLYSVNYVGASLDGDAINDSLSFDILVEAFSGGTISSSTSGSNGAGTAYSDGVATIGTDAAVTLNQTGNVGFSVNGGTFNEGQTLQYSVQNFDLTTSESGDFEASLLGFTSLFQRETGNSFGHQTIIGEGTGLTGLAWNVNNTFNFDSTGPGAFVVSSGSTPTGSNPQRFRIDDLAFSIDVSPVVAVPEPSSLAFLTMGGLALLTRRKR